MEEVNKLRVLYQLKNVSRTNSVGNRKESSAEHSWSCLLLADFFLGQMQNPPDRLKVYELLMYHDIVEIECGDISIIDVEGRKGKQEKEFAAMEVLRKKIPSMLSEKFVQLFTEFETAETREAKFARAIDFLDAQIHEMDYKEDWKGWTADMLRKLKGPHFTGFPEVNQTFTKITTYCENEGYFSQ